MTREQHRKAVKAWLLERRPDWKGRIRFNVSRDGNTSVTLIGACTMYWLEYDVPADKAADWVHREIEYWEKEEAREHDTR